VIARLTGRVVEADGTRGVVDVGGVGYEVFATERALAEWLGADGVTMSISTQVREDAITLYGFHDDTERKAFLTLLSVTGFGPKMALAALDTLAVDELYRAVEGDDLVALGRIPGVGSKKAQRLALELKGKLPVTFDGVVGAVRAPRARTPPDPLPLALAQLEYAKSEIDRALGALSAQGIGADAPLEVRIKAALVALSNSHGSPS
jgi:holliday junction DNA helicase RuvA